MLQRIFEAYADSPGGISEGAFLSLMHDFPDLVAVGKFSDVNSRTAFETSSDGRDQLDFPRFSQALYKVAVLRYPEAGESLMFPFLCISHSSQAFQLLCKLAACRLSSIAGCARQSVETFP